MWQLIVMNALIILLLLCTFYGVASTFMRVNELNLRVREAMKRPHFWENDSESK